MTIFVKVAFICISKNGWFDFSLNPSVKLHFRPHINIILLSHNAFVSGVIPFTAAVLPFSYPNGNKSRIRPIKKLLTERNTERKNTEINTSSGLFNVFVCPTCNRDIYFKKYCLISESKHWYILNPNKQFLQFIKRHLRLSLVGQLKETKKCFRSCNYTLLFPNFLRNPCLKIIPASGCLEQLAYFKTYKNSYSVLSHFKVLALARTHSA